MKILVNNEEIDLAEGSTPLEKISDLLAALKEKNLVILETWVNEVKTEEDLLELVKLNNVEQVALVVATPAQVVFDALETAITYLPVLKEGLLETAGLFQEGRDGEGIAKYLEALSGMGWLCHVLAGVDSCAAVEENLRGAFKKDHQNYEQILRDLTQAWENRDYVLIADLMEYELAPFVEGLLPLVQSAIEGFNQKD